MSDAGPGAGPRMHFEGVPAPKPLLADGAERRLTARQREILDLLERILGREDFAGWTMADLAAQLNCSLRTLYGIAPSKDELVLIAVDRRLRRIGRSALAPLRESMPPLEALRLYLHAAHEAVQPATAAYSRQLADVPGAVSLLDAHERYVIAVTRNLLDRAVLAQQIESVDTVAVAHVLGGLGREFARPELSGIVRGSARDTADEMVDILLRGLERR